MKESALDPPGPRGSPGDTTRRGFLLGALGGALVLPRSARAPGRGRSRDAGRTLVLVQLSGGNDGLSTLVPRDDDGYGRARSATRIEARELLSLDPRVGLHPGLARLHERFQRGELAIVEGVGYPGASRSHFRALDVWHAADPRGRLAGEGWVARTCRAAFGEERGVHRVVHIGARPPFSLHSSSQPPVAFTAPETYAWFGQWRDLEQLEQGPAQEPGSTLEFVHGMLRDARESSAAIRAAVARHEPAQAYPSSAFARDLRAGAALIQAELGVRVLSLELGGFDTHSDQRARHDRLMRELDQGLGAFLADLSASEAGREALVLCFSEFGRRVAENGSRGTDHGAAAPMLVLGARVRGGLHGAPPSLEDLVDGDLVHTTDFRSVYGAAIEHCFGVQHERVLGARFPRPEFL